VISVKDAARAIYAGDERALRSDLRFLESRDLISVDLVKARSSIRRYICNSCLHHTPSDSVASLLSIATVSFPWCLAWQWFPNIVNSIITTAIIDNNSGRH
jgi:hypothetical protein